MPADITNEKEKVEAEIGYLEQRGLCVHEKAMEKEGDLEKITSVIIETNDPEKNREEFDRLIAELELLHKEQHEINVLLLQKIKEKKELLFPQS